jgi:hypothetical protein
MERVMARPFGDYPAVENFLGRETLDALAAPDRAESYIIEVGSQPSRVGFASCTVFAQGPLLTDEQLARLRGYILRPEAHYNGQPVFRRRPSVPDFAFRFWRGDLVLDVLLDLHNPGWEFHCGAEHYHNWNWVGAALVSLAKELFPRLASSSRRAIWQKRAIKALQENKRAGRVEPTTKSIIGD